jgi:hypothetical protein
MSALSYMPLGGNVEQHLPAEEAVRHAGGHVAAGRVEAADGPRDSTARPDRWDGSADVWEAIYCPSGENVASVPGRFFIRMADDRLGTASEVSHNAVSWECERHKRGRAASRLPKYDPQTQARFSVLILKIDRAVSSNQRIGVTRPLRRPSAVI